jgi:glycosyltransferase involved in cell wall biosynthesis
MSRYLLDVLLPFHVYDDLLQEAIESCKKSLPANSRIIAINTLVDQKILNMNSDQILEVMCPKADYITALRFGLSKTQSKYVALMNSDDLINESRFINQIQALENSNFKMCAHDTAAKIHRYSTCAYTILCIS